MHGHERPAVRASPSGALELYERLHTDSAELTQVLDHAHAVLGAVPRVQLPKARARILGTVAAEYLRTLSKVLAPFDRACGAVMSLGGVVRVIAAGTSPALAKVADADPAVHPAGSHQLRRK